MLLSFATSILFLHAFGRAQAQASSQNLHSVPWAIERDQRISGRPPVYPSIAAIAHVQGCVYVRIVVSTDGSVERADYLGGMALMEESALNSAKTWKFNPSAQQTETVAQVCYFLSQRARSELLEPEQKAIDQRPTDREKVITFARDLLRCGSPDQAEVYFRRALSLNSNDAEATFGLGDSFAARGDFSAAAQAYRMILKSQDANEAAKQYKRALNSNQPSFFREEPFLHYGLGQALEAKGEGKQALKEYSTAVKEMPWNAEFQQTYSQLAGK